MKEKFAVQEIIDQEKLTKDLKFIASIQTFANEKLWRPVLSGGYGLDFYLHQVTRNHNDIDLILYGVDSRETTISHIDKYLSSLVPNSRVTIKPEQFYADIDLSSPGLGANIYYVQVVQNPLEDLTHVVRADGEVIENSIVRFPPPTQGSLNNIEIEVQDPNLHLADILFKRNSQEKRQSHEQDIHNLRLVTEEQRVASILALM